MKRIDLFVIDGQNDFCASGTEPDDWPWPAGGRRCGSLFVSGADKEAVKVAKMIERIPDRITYLRSTLDSHHHLDCSHNVAWKMSDGSSPPPFTIVTHADVKAQKYVPRFCHWRLGRQDHSAVAMGLEIHRGARKEWSLPIVSLAPTL
jgi:nicotinamidase/pyrazinamidase